MEIQKNEKMNSEDEENIENDYEYKEVRVDSIVALDWLPRQPRLVSPADHELKESIDARGLLNPLTVRGIGAGKYELLAGTRRFAAVKSSNVDTVWVHIKKDKSEYQCRADCSAENQHRKDIPEAERDINYAKMFHAGLREGEISSMSDMLRDVSFDIGTLRKYIRCGEERLKYKKNDVIMNASTSMLHGTRKLKDVPGVRNKLLEMGQNNMVPISAKDLTEICKHIDVCKDSGMSEKMISKMIDRCVDTVDFDNNNKKNDNVKVNGNNSEINGSVDVNNSVNKTNLSFNIDEFEKISSVMAVSFPDVREFIVSNKIDLDVATEINRFETIEARRQLVEEKLKLEKLKKGSQETFDNEWTENIKIRAQQFEEVKNNGKTILKTKFDIDKQQKLDLAKNADTRHDEDYFHKYRSLQDRLNRVILSYHPKNIKTDRGKETIGKMIREMYEILRLVLIEIGEIKGGSEGKTQDSDENNFNHHFINIDARIIEE